MKTLFEIKVEIAKQYNSNDYKRDFEYGMGVNSFLSEEDFFDKVAVEYARQACEKQRRICAEYGTIQSKGENYFDIIDNAPTPELL